MSLALESDTNCTARLNARLDGVAKALESWTRLKQRDLPSAVWGYPPVTALVTKLDWEVLLLGHAVASRGNFAGEVEVSEIERRLAEVETTISALDVLLSGSAPAAEPHYGYAI